MNAYDAACQAYLDEKIERLPEGVSITIGKNWADLLHQRLPILRTIGRDRPVGLVQFDAHSDMEEQRDELVIVAHSGNVKGGLAREGGRVDLGAELE